MLSETTDFTTASCGSQKQSIMNQSMAPFVTDSWHTLLKLCHFNIGVCFWYDCKTKSRPASKSILFKILPHKKQHTATSSERHLAGENDYHPCRLVTSHDRLKPQNVWHTFAGKITCSYLISYYAILILHSATCIVYSDTSCPIRATSNGNNLSATSKITNGTCSNAFQVPY